MLASSAVSLIHTPACPSPWQSMEVAQTHLSRPFYLVFLCLRTPFTDVPITCSLTLQSAHFNFSSLLCFPFSYHCVFVLINYIIPGLQNSEWRFMKTCTNKWSTRIVLFWSITQQQVTCGGWACFSIKESAVESGQFLDLISIYSFDNYLLCAMGLTMCYGPYVFNFFSYFFSLI